MHRSSLDRLSRDGGGGGGAGDGKVEFLDQHSAPGQVLLHVVARGNAVIAELFRLAEHIPPVFASPASAGGRYAEVLPDFRYLRSPEAHERRIESPELLELDADVWEVHGTILERFYRLFESVYAYLRDVSQFVAELEAGAYLQHSAETVLQDHDGKQLLCEAFYLFGAVLLLLDQRIDGAARERMVVSFYRHRGASTIQNVDDVVTLTRATGFSPAALDKSGAPKRPAGYPEDFFARMLSRFGTPLGPIELAVTRLRSDDVYGHTAEYPLPAHRSTALSTQARMLYVILYFVPRLLHDEPASMREIVDRHFSDNWVSTLYMGITVDLAVAWEPYRAARAALANTLAMSNVRAQQAAQLGAMRACAAQLAHYLTEGALSEEVALDSSQKILGLVRQCNVSLRWLVLHQCTRPRKLREAVLAGGLEPDDVLAFLMDTAQLEFAVKSRYEALLSGRTERFGASRARCVRSLDALAVCFASAESAAAAGAAEGASAARSDGNLSGWFHTLARAVDELDVGARALSARRLQALSRALEEVEAYEQLAESLQLLRALGEARRELAAMLRVVNADDGVLVTLALVSDMSYAFDAIAKYIPLMHARMRSDPFCVLKLRATFLKLVSVVELPAVRITQAESDDLVSVSQFYSTQLVRFVRRVLQVIPESVLAVLAEVVALRTSRLKELPLRLPWAELREWEQPDVRYALARATHRIAVLAEGVLSMQTTLLGIAQLDPAAMLTAGLRRELVGAVARALHEGLCFGKELHRTLRAGELEGALEALSAKLSGFRSALEYVADYVRVLPVRLWAHDFARVIGHAVEREASAYLPRARALERPSRYQTDDVPIPTFPPPPSDDSDALTFVGRAAHALLVLSDARRSTYVAARSAWVEPGGGGAALIDLRTWHCLARALGRVGLVGIAHVLSLRVVATLRALVADARAVLAERDGANLLRSLAHALQPLDGTREGVPKQLADAAARLAKLWPKLVDALQRIGCAQLLLVQIGRELSHRAQLESSTLASAVGRLDAAALADARAFAEDPPSHADPCAHPTLLRELREYSRAMGALEPFATLYAASGALPELPLLATLCVLHAAPRLQYDRGLGELTARARAEMIDGPALAAGVATLVHQFHAAHARALAAHLGQYVRAAVLCAPARELKPGAELPADVAHTVLLLEVIARHVQLTDAELCACVPPYVLGCARASAEAAAAAAGR